MFFRLQHVEKENTKKGKQLMLIEKRSLRFKKKRILKIYICKCMDRRKKKKEEKKINHKRINLMEN